MEEIDFIISSCFFFFFVILECTWKQTEWNVILCINVDENMLNAVNRRKSVG